MTDLDALTTAAHRVELVRRRMLASSRLASAVRGLVVGCGVALVGATVELAAVGPPSPLWSIAPFLVAGVCVLRSEGAPAADVAALALDRRAGTEEAFLTSLADTVVPDAWRRLAAESALDRCDDETARRLFPLEAPAGLALALGLAAVLSALLLLPRVEPDEATTETTPGRSVAVSGGGPSAADGSAGATTPAQRLAQAAAAVRERGRTAVEERADPLADDLPAVSDDELEALSRALADAGDASGEAALEALADGRREAAVEHLRDALLGPAGDGAGGNAAGAPSVVSPDESPDARPSGGATWSLRYDRTVRAWFRTRNPNDGPRGGR